MGKSIRSNPTVHAVQGDERIRTAVASLGTDYTYESRGGVSCRARDLRPLDVFRWHGFVFECERQARRTTVGRALGDPLDGARVQIKHNAPVALIDPREARDV